MGDGFIDMRNWSMKAKEKKVRREYKSANMNDPFQCSCFKHLHFNINNVVFQEGISLLRCPPNRWTWGLLQWLFLIRGVTSFSHSATVGRQMALHTYEAQSERAVEPTSRLGWSAGERVPDVLVFVHEEVNDVQPWESPSWKKVSFRNYGKIIVNKAEHNSAAAFCSGGALL